MATDKSNSASMASTLRSFARSVLAPLATSRYTFASVTAVMLRGHRLLGWPTP